LLNASLFLLTFLHTGKIPIKKAAEDFTLPLLKNNPFYINV